jgi:hypothetical protein
VRPKSPRGWTTHLGEKGGCTKSSWTATALAVRVAAGKVTMLTRRGLNRTARVRLFIAPAERLAARTAYIDGDVAVRGRARVRHGADDRCGPPRHCLTDV